jgi:putative heme transporter
VRAGRPSRVKLLGSLLLAVAIFAFLLRRVDVDAVRAEIQEMTWFELVTIAVIAGWNLVTYWALWMAVTPGLRWTQAMTVAQSGTAVTNTVPGGSGIGVGLAMAMLDSWGFSRARSTLAVLITGVWNTFIKLALPVLALALIALQGDASASRVAAGATAIVLLGVAVGGFWQMLRSDRAAARAGVLAERIANRAIAAAPFARRPVHGWAEATTRFRSRARDLLQGRGGWITAAALVSHLSLYLVLLVTLRHVGVGDAEVGWAQVLFVFAGARLATAIRFTPGGAGVVEAVLIGGLVAFGGDPAQVTASVLVFRALTWLLPVPLGGLTYLAWRWRQHRLAAPTASVVPAAPAEPRSPSP